MRKLSCITQCVLGVQPAKGKEHAQSSKAPAVTADPDHIRYAECVTVTPIALKLPPYASQSLRHRSIDVSMGGSIG